MADGAPPVVVCELSDFAFFGWFLPQLILSTPPSESVLKIPKIMNVNGKDEIIADITEMGTWIPNTRVLVPLRLKGNRLNTECEKALSAAVTAPDALRAQVAKLEKHFCNLDWADSRIQQQEMALSVFKILRNTLKRNDGAIRAIDILVDCFPSDRRQELKFAVLVQVIQEIQLRNFDADFAIKLIREYFPENLLDQEDHEKKNVLHHAYAAGAWKVIDYVYEHCKVNVMKESANLYDKNLNGNLIVTFLTEQCFCYDIDHIKKVHLERLLRHISVPHTKDGVTSIMKMLEQISGIMRKYDIVDSDKLEMQQQVTHECEEHMKGIKTKIACVAIALQMYHIPKDIIEFMLCFVGASK